MKEVYFKNYKPIEIFKCDNIDEAIEICKEYQDKNIWAYFEIKTDSPLPPSKIKEMKQILPNIVEIKPILPEDEAQVEDYEITEKSMLELFEEFYLKERGVTPSQDLIDLFVSIVKEEDEEDETFEA